MRFIAGVVHQESQGVPTIEVFCVGGGPISNGEYQRGIFLLCHQAPPKKTRVIKVLRWFFEWHTTWKILEVSIYNHPGVFVKGVFTFPPQKKDGITVYLKFRNMVKYFLIEKLWRNLGQVRLWQWRILRYSMYTPGWLLKGFVYPFLSISLPSAFCTWPKQFGTQFHREDLFPTKGG